jgi:hypothetical protein
MVQPCLHYFPPCPVGLPPREWPKREIDGMEQEKPNNCNEQLPNSHHRLERKEVTSYADPKKICKYESIKDICGERPACVMQKKRHYEQTVWIKDDNPQHPVLDMIGSSRTYNPKARWAKPPNFCTCPCELKCYQSSKDFKSFSDEAWSSDDDDYSESYYNKNSKSMCV